MTKYQFSLVLLTSVLSFSSSLQAACVTGDCAEMGYTKSENACSGDIIRCPFDTSKVFCKALDDTCPLNYSKTPCNSSQVTTGTQKTEAGTTCYKCEDYCTYTYPTLNSANEKRKTMILTSTCSGWSSWMGLMKPNETKQSACLRDNKEHRAEVESYNVKCPNKKISKIYDAACNSCCYSTNNRPGYLQICRDI